MLRTASLALALLASPLLAGGGPETTLVVVNGRSPVSRWIANEYRKLRSIPASHLVVLDGVPHDGVITLAEFREKIWKPVAGHIERAGLDVELVAYSADFPYGVDFRKAYGEAKPTQDVGGIAALTGVTYLIRQVEAGADFWSYRRLVNRWYRLGGNEKKQLTGEERKLAMDAQQLQRAGKLRDARAKYEAFLEIAPGYGRVWVAYASCLAAQRETDAAFEALKKAAAHGFDRPGMVESQPAFAGMRGDPRWKAVLEGMAGALSGLRPTTGFRAFMADAEDPHRYVPAVQLAYTGFLGNSVPEVLSCLRASAKADGTAPGGTVYVCKNGNVRSKAREAFFGPLVSALRARGRKVEILENTKLPPKKNDVIGAVVGTAGFDWKSSGSTILPGAICEHLTSFGAHFGTAGQTKLSAFLRYGAAGASGTVQEPLAIHLKFPNPLIHAFYADGCNLAESFYQSVASPYQLMIAGDGLCQPFAKAPEFDLPVPERPWSGTVELAPKGEFDFEYWVDGKRVATGPSCSFDASSGWHELAVVAVARDRVGARGAVRFERAREPVSVKYGEPVPLPKGVTAFYGTRELGEGPVPSDAIGPGPARLVLKDGRASWVLDVEVTLPEPVPAVERAEPRLGLLAEVDGEERIVTSMASRPAGVRLRDQLGGKGKVLRLNGAVFAPSTGAFQFNRLARARSVRHVSGLRVLDGPGGRQSYELHVLAKGWHAFAAEVDGSPDVELMVAGAQPASAPRFARMLPDVPAPEVEADKEGGYKLTWKRTRKIAAVGVFPAKGEELPAGWTVETSRSRRGRWKAADGVKVLLAPSPSRPGKGKKAPPVAAELVFEPVRTKYLRVVPTNAAKIEGAVVSRLDE